MKSSRIDKTAKTIFTGKKTNSGKTRFLILASFVLIAVSTTVVFSSTSAASSVAEFIFSSISPNGTPIKTASKDDKSKKDPKSSKLRQLAPNTLVAETAISRQDHTATRLSGDNVLIVGGDAAGTAEIIDAATGVSSAAGNLTVARSGHTATKISDDKVLITGGTSGGAAIATTEIYNSSTGTFSAGATMNQARTGHTATTLADGRILIAGGDSIGSAEIYDAAAGTFTAIATMTTARSNHSAALMNDGRVLIVGGEELNSAEIFDPSTSSFSATGNQMEHHRTHAVLRVLPDGKVQIIGGNEDLSMEVYDPAIDTIGAHGHLIPTNDEHDNLLQSDILSAPTRHAMFHNGQTDALLDRSNFTVTELGDKAFIAGGVDSNGNVLSSSTLLNSSNATVTTDKLDYQPGQTAVISGTGWQAGETVNIILHEDPHTTTERRLSVQADASGNFSGNYSVVERDLDVTFIIGAKGQTSARTAQTTFTDTSNQITKIGFNTVNQPASFTVGVSNVTSSPLRIQTQNTGGSGENVTGGGSVAVTVTTNSATGGFSLSSSGPFASSINLTISGAQNSSDFFYRDTTAGNIILTATVTDKSNTNLTNNQTGTLTKTVNKANTITTVSSSPNPSNPSQSVTFTATAAHAATGGAGTLSGTVTFKDGATTLGTGTLGNVAGQFQATFSTSSLSIGTHSTITAVYEGDSNFNTSTSPNYSQTVNTYPTTTTLSSSPNPSNVGQSVAFTIMTTDSAPNGTIDKTGVVTLRDGGTDCLTGASLGTDTLNASNKIAHISTSALTAGSHNIRACYAGDSNYAASSGITTQTVNAAAPTTLNVSAASGIYGGTANLTATLTQTSGGASVSGKTISFTLNGNSVGTATTNASGLATLSNVSLSGINAGTYATGTTASFVGDASFAASNNSNSLTVSKATPTITWANPADINYGTALGVTQLNATASVAGTFAYNPAASAILSAGNAQNLSLVFTPTDSANYTTANKTVQINVLKKSLTANVSADNKVYDGTNAATLSGKSLTGVVGTDDVTLTGGTATFDTKDVGTGKIVTATGLSLTGTAAGNYVLASATATTTANITAKAASVIVNAASKTYGDTDPTFTGNLNGFIAADNITANYSRTAGENVAGSPYTISATLSPAGALGNYNITNNTANFTINAKALTINASGQNKEYDGTANATVTLSIAAGGVINGDQVNATYTSATFTDKNVGTGKTINVTGIALTGTGASNYTTAANASTTTANITAKSLTASVTAANKVYDGTTAATITACNLGAGVVSGDTVNCLSGAATFDSKSVGNGKTVTANGLTLSGADAGNYTVNSTATALANITARSLVVTATGVDKVYDGTTAATVSFGDDRVSGDTLTIGYASASFNDKNVGNGKAISISGVSLSGADAGNYSLSSATASASANITSKALNVTATGADKIYDGNTTATVNLSSDKISGDALTLVYTSASFADKAVGTAKTINVSGISVSGTDASNYNLISNSTTATASITARTLVVSATGMNKVYDGNTTANVTLSDNRVSGDTLTTNFTSATFDTKSAGTGKTVTVSGISVSGADAGNYNTNTSTATTADITAKALAISASGVNKVYDGNTTATVTLSDNRISGDDFTASYASASFTDKHVGNGKSVAVSGISISGADAGNYSANYSTTTTANITGRTLTVTATGINKVYDGTTTATVNLIGDGISGDDVTLGYSAGFDNKSVGTGKTISVTGIAITGGTDAGNYTLGNTTTGTTANITPKALTVTASASNKQYDGNDSASITLTIQAGGVVGGDIVGTSFGSAVFDSKNVGAGKIVTVNGIALTDADGGNYSANATATATADITAKTLAAIVAVDNKIYDATTTATISNRSLSGVLAPDVVNLIGGTAEFVDKNVGSGKSVNIVGLSLSGTDAGNYSINNSVSATANIAPKTLTVTATGVSKEYDATTAATVTLSGDQISGDAVTLGYTTASFTDKNVGANKSVSIVGISITGGADGGNYTLGNKNASANANIIAKSLTVTATGQNKEYDGNATAVVALVDNRIAGDVFTASYTGALFDSKSVGTGKTVSVTGISISGTDAGNYSLANTTAATTANINAKSLTVSATGQNKVYDATAAATVTLSIAGKISGDEVSANSGGALFADKNVGAAKIVTVSGITLSGAEAGNYSVNITTTTTADITGATVTGSFTAAGKVYDGNTSATITGRSLTGTIGADVISLDGGMATFDNKNVGTGKTVTANDFNLTGADAGNYILAAGPLTATAGITARALSVSATGVNKVYDGNTTATVNLTTDKLTGDDVSASYNSATFGDKFVGTGKAIGVSGIAIGSADAGNYTFNATTATTADITAKNLTVSAAGVNKVYDGNTTATVTLSDNRVSGDVFTASYASAAFNNKNVGTAKSVSVSGISISGTDAGNYTFNATASTNADITVLAITGNITASDKVYDGNATAAIATRTLTGAVSGDVVNYVSDASGTATFDNKNVGAGKTVTATVLKLSGADAGNYRVNATATTTANITARTLTVTATASNKVFDGTTAASVSLSDNRVSGDVLNVAYTSANFDNANIGTGKTVTVVGISISGADAGNYIVNTNTTNNTIATTAASITAFGTTTTVMVTPNSQQYSDKVTFTATIAPGFAGAVPAASTVTFFVGTQNMGTANLSAGTGVNAGKLVGTLSDAALLEGVTGQMSPGNKTVTATFGGVNPNFTVGSPTASLTIAQETAAADFSGATYFATASSTSSTANLTLSTTLTDASDGSRGDIRNAKVEFHLGSPTGSLLGGANLPVGLVNSSDSTVGTATATNISFTLSNADFTAQGASILVYTVVKNYYATTVSDPTTITISVPGTDGVTGGGHQVMTNSNGQYAGAVGSKMNFGFTMKYNTSGKNLKGQANIIVHSNGKIYQIKSNAVDSLALVGTAYPNRFGTLTTKANMTDITDPLNPISLGGNLRLQIDMTDASLGGQTDLVGITLFDGNGGLFFSSYWDGTKTVQKLLGGGNISVR